jgi:hypothetical protein
LPVENCVIFKLSSKNGRKSRIFFVIEGSILRLIHEKVSILSNPKKEAFNICIIRERKHKEIKEKSKNGKSRGLF